jgi:Domain of unknown function (DUF4337)
MSVNEELQEHSEHAHDDFSRMAGGTMAIIAAVLAVVAVYGHITTTEELLMQQKASDQWAFYQAKALRRYQSEVALDLMHAMPGEVASKTAGKYSANLERYAKEAEEIQEKAKEYAKESEIAGKKALRLHLGEILLELAIVFSSLAILARKREFWVIGVASAVLGVAVSATVLLVQH